MPPKTRTSYRCTAVGCGATHAKWAGKCSMCQAWGTVEEVASEATRAVGMKGNLVAASVTRSASRVRDISTDRTKHRPTGIGELDRVLGGGFVSGGVILLAAEPGFGKSTLVLDVANRVAETGLTVLIISGEESREQIKLRAQRIGANADDLFIADDQDLSVALGHIEEVKPDLVIIDSIQTIASPNVEGRAGGVAQTIETATALTRVAKSQGIPMILIGQITKDGNIAGPQVVVHLVDTVIFGEGDKHSTLRMLRTIKNRFGPADEVGCFVMEGDGIKEVADPSGLFVGQRETPVAGTCVTIVVEGKRPLPAEIQALVSQSNIPVPRRGQSGLDNARFNMLLAIVEKHGKLKLYDKDIWGATVGGMKISEPSADLALALAIASACNDTPLIGSVIALGEVALSGDIRPVPDIERRLAEAFRMGFKTALVPVGTKDKLVKASGLTLVEVGHIGRALQAVAAMQAAGGSTRPRVA